MVYPFVLKNQNTKLIILVGLILAAGIGFHFLPVRQWFAELESYIDSLGRIGPLVVALGYVVTTVLCIPGSAITIGTATDPYQPVEGRYRLTRGALELLREHANPVSLLTKSPMIVRDTLTITALPLRMSSSIARGMP